jgi:CRP/FNR family nitrogen fixation transcriptional regulator
MSTDFSLQSVASPSSAAMPICWTDPEDDEAAGLQAAGSQIRFAQGRAIYYEGDKALFFFKVISGVVRTCKLLTDGRRQIDAFYVSGEIFGFELSSEHDFSAEAVCDCVVVPYRRYDIASPKALPITWTEKCGREGRGVSSRLDG